MFLKQTLKNTKTNLHIFRLFNTFGPGEDLRNTKKGMVGIYSFYVWQKKPILVKGSLNRYRNFMYIEDLLKHESQNTPGDSFGTHASTNLLKKKFIGLKFTNLEKSLKKYYNWINKLPTTSKLKKYHPLREKNKD